MLSPFWLRAPSRLCGARNQCNAVTAEPSLEKPLPSMRGAETSGGAAGATVRLVSGAKAAVSSSDSRFWLSLKCEAPGGQRRGVRQIVYVSDPILASYVPVLYLHRKTPSFSVVKYDGSLIEKDKEDCSLIKIELQMKLRNKE